MSFRTVSSHSTCLIVGIYCSTVLRLVALSQDYPADRGISKVAFLTPIETINQSFHPPINNTSNTLCRKKKEVSSRCDPYEIHELCDGQA